MKHKTALNTGRSDSGLRISPGGGWDQGHRLPVLRCVQAPKKSTGVGARQDRLRLHRTQRHRPAVESAEARVDKAPSLPSIGGLVYAPSRAAVQYRRLTG